MAKQTSDIFHVTLKDWVFFDPKFNKNYNGYLPISKAFLSSKTVEKLSASEFRYLIALIDLAHTYKSPSFDLSSTFIRANGVLCLTLLTRLKENQALSFLINKEIKELNNKEENPLKEIEIPEENFSMYFQHFVTKEMGSLDLGFVKNYHLKAKKAFVTIAGFKEFCTQIMKNKTFNGIDADNQISYFKKAFTEEIKTRGCL